MAKKDFDINVPKKWSDITVRHFETFCLERPQTAHEQVAWAEKVCKVESGTFLGLPASVFNAVVEKLAFLFDDNPAEPNPRIEIDGVPFVVPIEDELSLGAWVDAEEVQKSGEALISNILAIVCRPVGEKYDPKLNDERQKMFAALPTSEVLGVLAFFLHCKNVLEARTEAYSRVIETFDLLPKSTKHLLNRGGGTKLSRIWRAAHYWLLMKLLRNRLRKFSLFYNTVATKKSRK